MPIPTDAELIALWRAWDLHPGRVTETQAMVDACNAAADLIEMPRDQFRDLLQTWRRTGLDYIDCIRITRDGWLRYSRRSFASSVAASAADESCG